MHAVCQQNREISITKFCQHLQTRSTGNARRFSCFFCCLSADNRNRTKRPLSSGNCLQYGISFCTNRHGIRCIFHIAAQKHSAVCSLQGCPHRKTGIRCICPFPCLQCIIRHGFHVVCSSLFSVGRTLFHQLLCTPAIRKHLITTISYQK